MVSCGKRRMDPMSLAYDSEATKDDGNCTYPANEKRSLVFKFTANGVVIVVNGVQNM